MLVAEVAGPLFGLFVGMEVVEVQPRLGRAASVDTLQVAGRYVEDIVVLEVELGVGTFEVRVVVCIVVAGWGDSAAEVDIEGMGKWALHVFDSSTNTSAAGLASAVKEEHTHLQARC